jgi:hypothetical protein
MSYSVRRKFMQSAKPCIRLAVAVAATVITSTALGGKYDDLTAKGFRWATADGPFATVSKDDAHLVANHPPDNVILKMVEQVKVYYLTPGTIVQVTEDDAKTGISKIRMAGITSDLWTLTRFLSKRPVKDTYGVIETPETSGLIPTTANVLDVGPTPTPSFGPAGTPGASPIPGESPLSMPSASPIPEEGPLSMPTASPIPGESPLSMPTASPPTASPTPETTQ